MWSRHVCMRCTDTHLFFIGGDDADICRWYGVVESLSELAAVHHDLHGFSRIKPRWITALSHLSPLQTHNPHIQQTETHARNLWRCVRVSTYPDAMKYEREALSWKPVPVAESVHHRPLRANTQLTGVKQTRRQLQQSLVGSVVIDQLSHLQNNKNKKMVVRW